MNRRRIILFVPGILTMPGDARDWNIEAIKWVNIHTEFKADDFEYFTTPLTRPLYDRDRAQKFAAVLLKYSKAGFSISIAAHSNGCDVTLDALRMAGWPRVEALHLVSAACESDFDKNGINHALLRERVGKVVVYVSGKDLALRLARTWLGKLLGYGTLGLSGPQHLWHAVANRVTSVNWPNNGHSTCWQPVHFDRTMKLLTI